ncbi:MAG: glycosyl hydrolase family 65 protein [Aggregatilineales bacterium]
MSKAARYLDLCQTVDQPETEGSVFTCGLRCVAEISLKRDSFGRTATSPVDVLTEVNFSIGQLETLSIQIFPNHVEKSHRVGEFVTARSIWFAAWEHPLALSWWRFTNTKSEQVEISIEINGELNLNYVSKFRKYANDTAAIESDRVEFRDFVYKNLAGCIKTNPKWDKCSIFDVQTPQNQLTTIATPCAIGLRMVKNLTIPPAGEADFVLCVSGSDSVETARDAVTAGIEEYASIYEQFLDVWDRRLNTGLILETPVSVVNELFMTNKLWAFKDTRIAPFGAPFSTETMGEFLPVLTASPDYHGVFANDNVQSAWEWGSIGEDFYPVLQNSIDVLYNFGTPESVEIDPINATGRPWIQTLELGPKPQWVMGACSLILWSGNKSIQLWRNIQNVLGQFFQDDRDGDYLDDVTCSPYPEQPDPGEFNHEMLYANTFWVQAFRMGSVVAQMFGDVKRQAEYQQHADRIAKAINEKFRTEYGYASWLNANHEQHPHPGHNMILPLQYHLASIEHAEKTFHTIFSEPQWTEEGMLVSSPEFPMRGGQYVWAFMRWNLIHALFVYSKTEEGLRYLVKWAQDEKHLHFQAPEGFPTITGVTGKGYSWTSGRMIRSILFGLCGMKLLAGGMAFEPRLPATWDTVHLKQLPFRGAVYHINIRRDTNQGVFLNGVRVQDGIISGKPGMTHEVEILVHPR